jgi:hypothetical protein
LSFRRSHAKKIYSWDTLGSPDPKHGNWRLNGVKMMLIEFTDRIVFMTPDEGPNILLSIIIIA